jgi:hypothetical protein
MESPARAKPVKIINAKIETITIIGNFLVKLFNGFMAHSPLN